MVGRVLAALTIGAAAVGVAPRLVASSTPPTTYRHLLVTGQSVAQGLESVPVLTTSQPFDNTMLAFEWAGDTRVYTSLVPLVEGGYPHNGETIASSWANTARVMQGADFRAIVSRHGVSGYSYSQLAKGTVPYADGMAQVAKVQELLTANGDRQVVDAVAVIHGDADDVPYGQSTPYAANLLQWQADYQADVRAITGQNEPVVLMTDQMGQFASVTSAIPFAQLDASRVAPGAVVLVGPKYFLDYVGNGHLSNVSQRLLGEYYAKVYDSLRQGQGWTPLSPKSATWCGATVRLQLHVPAGPLVFDTTQVAAAQDYGFEFADGSGAPPTIDQVAIAGPDTIELTLSRAPGSNPRLRYAFTAGPGSGDWARGNVRDSDPTVGLSGTPLSNWLVHFDEPITQNCTPGPTTTTVPVATTTTLSPTTTTRPTSTTSGPSTTRPAPSSIQLDVSVSGRQVTLDWSQPSTGEPDHYRIDTGFPGWGSWTQSGQWTGSVFDADGLPPGTYTATVTALVAGAPVADGSAPIAIGGVSTTSAPPSTTTTTRTSTTSPSSSTTSAPPSTVTTTRPSSSLVVDASLAGNQVSLTWSAPASGTPDLYRIDAGVPGWGTWTQAGLWTGSVYSTDGLSSGTYTATVTALVNGSAVAVGSAGITVGGQPTTTVPSPTTTTRTANPTTTTTRPTSSTTTTRPSSSLLVLQAAVEGQRVSLNWSEPATGAPDLYRIDTGFPGWGTWTQLGMWTGSVYQGDGLPSGTYTATVTALVDGVAVAQGSVGITIDGVLTTAGAPIEPALTGMRAPH